LESSVIRNLGMVFATQPLTTLTITGTNPA